MNRIMITTSGRVASNMTAQGFNIKIRDFHTGRFIPFEILPSTIETTGIWSVDEVNHSIVERNYKDTVSLVDTMRQTFLHFDDRLKGFGGNYRFVDDRRNKRVVSENHTVYDRLSRYDNGDSFYNHLDARFQCDKRNVCWLNKCYEIYA